jgi:Rha family phage regulatory protein
MTSKNFPPIPPYYPAASEGGKIPQPGPDYPSTRDHPKITVNFPQPGPDYPPIPHGPAYAKPYPEFPAPVPASGIPYPAVPAPVFHVELEADRDGRPVADSVGISVRFGKRHDNVIRDIRELIASTGNALNFEAVEYRDAKGEMRPAYTMNRDAFSLLVMGFTGKDALQWKLAYIDAFNRMEAALRGRREPERALSRAELARNWAEAEERLETAENARLASEAQNRRLNNGIHALAAVAEFQENELAVRMALERGAGSVTPSRAAKLLGQPVKKFNAWCIKRYIFYRGKLREPYAHWLTKGIMEMKFFNYKDLNTPTHLREYFDSPQPGWTSYSIQPFFTDKGLRHLALLTDLPDPNALRLLEKRAKIRSGVAGYLDDGDA